MTEKMPVIKSGMPYTYSEHISDIGIEARGSGLLSAFEAGVEAALNIMFNLDTIDEKVSVEVAAEAGDIELLFVEVINEVISLQGRDELALKRIKADSIEKRDGGFAFRGAAWGEKFDPARHEVRTEVKGATYSGLSYNNGEGGEHVLSCVLDV